MLEDPDGIEVVLEHEEDFLQSRNLGVPVNGTGFTIQIDGLIDE
jgi:hypothetical protein